MYIPRHVVTICSWRHKFYSPSITHYHFPFLTKKSLIYYKYNLSLLINFLISIRNKVNHTYIHTRYKPVRVNVPPQKPEGMKLLQIPWVFISKPMKSSTVCNIWHTQNQISQTDRWTYSQECRYNQRLILSHISVYEIIDPK